MARRSAPKSKTWSRLCVAALSLSLGYAAFEYRRLPDVTPLAKENPKDWALLRHRADEAKEAGKKPRVRHTWVSVTSLPRYLPDAVIVSEDAAFWIHEGVDHAQLRHALQQSVEKGELGRGASTITQQLAKNLYLSGERSLLRKAKELLIAKRLEEGLTKARILALYLNVIEWGDGVYGVEEGARAHFGTSAREVSLAEAAMLASMLPSPRKWLPSKKPAVLQKRSRTVVDRLEKYGKVSAVEAAAARAELERFFGGGAGEGDVETPD